MIPRFGRPAPVLSMVTNKVIDLSMTPMDGESSNGITTFSVQHIYKHMQMLCTQRVQPLKIVLDLWMVLLSQLHNQMKIKEWSIMDTKGCMP